MCVVFVVVSYYLYVWGSIITTRYFTPDISYPSTPSLFFPSCYKFVNSVNLFKELSLFIHCFFPLRILCFRLY